MKTIACLHTAASNIAIFDAACPPGVTLTHAVREDLLRDAEVAGSLTADIADRTAHALAALALPGVDAVLLTCSTVGPGAARTRAPVPVLRVDAALAEQAAAGGGRIVVLCAVETTVEPSRRLFAEAAGRHGATIEVRLVPDAWAAFRAGDVVRYHALVAAASDAAFADGAAAVALAQASMAGAASLAARRAPLTSPACGLAAALAAVTSPPLPR
jgi:hypothetical protein